MTVQTTHRNGHAVVSLDGDIDMRNVPRVRDALLRGVARHGDLVVDLSRIRRIDFSGLAVLVEALDAARRSGRRLALAGVPPGPMRMFRLARLDRVFPMSESVEEVSAEWRARGHGS